MTIFFYFRPCTRNHLQIIRQWKLYCIANEQMCILRVEQQLHTYKMQKRPKPSIMNSEQDSILLRISEKKRKK